MDALNPDPGVLSKLASLVVYIEEFFSVDGDPLDKVAIESLLTDEQIVSWLNEMEKLALAPKKRKDHEDEA